MKSSYARSITITRRTADTIDSNGFAVAGTVSTITVPATVQPDSSFNTLNSLPEGRRNSECFKIYTGTRLSITGSNPDLISYNGISLEIFKEFSYLNGVIYHYKYLAMRKV